MKETEKDLQETKPVSQNIPQPQMPYYQMPPSEDEIDLFELFSSLFSQWKLIISVTAIGTLISIIYALNIPKVYESSASVRMPSTSQIAPINENGYIKFTRQQIFKRYFDQIKSKENLKNYLIKTNAIPEIFPDINKKDVDRTAIAFAEGLNVATLEPKARKGTAVPIPDLFELSLSRTAEAETVAVLNGYIQHIEDMVLEKIKDESSVVISLRSNNINRDIQHLRAGAKRSRELLIEKLTIGNQEKINKIQQQIELLVEKSKKQRANQIKRLIESRNTAEALNITEPTTLALLAQRNLTVQAKYSTQVDISSNNLKSDFLMGTQYLDNQIKLLKSRERDLPYIDEVPDLLREISSLKKSVRIDALVSRESDDPFIDSLPEKLNELDRLKHITFEFGDASLYQVNQTAAADGVAEKPNRKLIVILGTLLSGMLALFIALIVSAAQKRSTRELENQT